MMFRKRRTILQMPRGLMFKPVVQCQCNSIYAYMYGWMTFEPFHNEFLVLDGCGCAAAGACVVLMRCIICMSACTEEGRGMRLNAAAQALESLSASRCPIGFLCKDGRKGQLHQTTGGTSNELGCYSYYLTKGRQVIVCAGAEWNYSQPEHDQRTEVQQ